MKHTVRAKYPPENTVEITPYTRGRAIKLFCTECLGFEDHPRDCTAKLCPLFPFRGKSTLAFNGGGE